MENVEEQKNEQTVPPPVNHVIVNQKKSYGCLWFILGAVAFCFVIFAAAAIFGAVIASIFGGIQDSDDDQFDSYERRFIAGDKSSRNTLLVIPVDGIILSDDDSSPFAPAMASAEKICRHLD
ncbi:MAG: hypothetical protein PHV82_05650, partial [Victivallaceae bacterium]|nr:hypothetical protein [Victivallaceae bacterium]